MADAQDILLTNFEDSLETRLEQTESSLEELKKQNEELAAKVKELEPAEEEAEEKVAEEELELPEPEEEKEPEWYDKIKIRGYAQLRYNYPLHLEDGSAPYQHPGDSSIGNNQEFLLRRARMIFYGDITDHLYIYIQPDFAATPDGSTEAIHFAQLRDWYGDIYLDDCKIHRFRVGQSKVPYGWENLQSSSNRLTLDRDDAFNSATRNERDLGIFYYWTPEWAQDTFKMLTDEGLKGSGNYGIFGCGVHNGQGGSFREQNDNLHFNARLTYPYTLPDGQVVEFGIQGYTGQYVVGGSAIAPLGVGPAVVPLGTRGRVLGEEGQLDQRAGVSFVYYPQPLGFQAEYTVGEGPELNAAQTVVERGSLHGGYLMTYYRWQTRCHGEIWPFVRWQTYEGGYKFANNAPSADISEWNIGCEWQIRKELELVCEYLVTDRTNLTAQTSGTSYQQFAGDVLRFQLQFNY